MTGPDPGSVLRRALLVWGFGHLSIGRPVAGAILAIVEVLAAAAVWWLTVWLADTSLYLVPFLAGMAFIVAWAWQAIAAYQAAHVLRIARPPTPERSPAAAIGWLSLPLLLWGSGFWLIGASSATPAAALDRFVTQWSAGELGSEWPPDLVRAADRAERRLGDRPDRFRDVRIRIDRQAGPTATAIAQSIHYERREARFLWVFPGSELVPVVDMDVLVLDLQAEPAPIPLLGDVGAVHWRITGGSPPP
ncbi:MAG: hypothetical protein K5924_11210 [Chloroflexi bacterium]|nr:hypothetical protein [Chloroflexota bacterium]